MTNQEILQSLAGDETAFSNALRSLGWFDYPPTLSEAPYKGTARAALNPRLRFCGNIEQGNVHVYRLLLPNAATWRDTVAVAESHLRAEPQFAIFFRSLPGAILIVVPADPDKARNKSHSITAACAYIRTENPSANDLQTIERLRHAPRDGFRRPLQEMANAERVTKKFYDEFDKKARTPFLANIQGIPDDKDRDWYASVMLNRIMFLFFLQEQGYMDNDLRYLPNRLANFRGNHPKNLFHRGFMLPLFHDALGSRTHADALKELTGDVPYLNGGIFAKHALEEKYGENIAIPDEAYDAIFRFFGDWNWCLDDRPMRTEREINPDVLGYIFEKYINRKQMGAYYTKEDITEYIGRNTIVPFLVERSLENYAFRVTDLSTGKPDPDKMHQIKSKMLGLLRERPDDYIFDAVKKGTNIPLPPEIEEGISDVSKRGPWNKPAPEEYALPTEWWREVVARRQRYEEIISSIAGKESFDINDFITLNLNIRQWLEDFLHVCDDEAYLAAFRETLTQCRILDPTCGSGAFLFAALNILLPLYDAVDPNADPYHTLKTIILHNLYGVDIMEEAVEICKLRLFLKLAAQKPPHPDAPNHGLEPLPDMDFNIRAGNTLVGYATLDQLEKGLSFDAAQGKLGFEDEALQRILGQAEKIRELYELFCEEQLRSDTEVEREVMSIRKATMRCELNALNEELDQLLAKQYGVQPGWKQAYAKWKESHRPFHWFTEFYGAMSRGGFDVIIGNPPYVEYGNVRGDYAIRGYETESCGNLYAFVMERNISIVQILGRSGMIVPHSCLCTDRMYPVIDLLKNASTKTWVSSYDIRPAKLFVGVDQRLAIYLCQHKIKNPLIESSRYHRWNEEARSYLFNTLKYWGDNEFEIQNSVVKIEQSLELVIWRKIIKHNPIVLTHSISGTKIYYHNAPRYWIRAMDFAPYFWNERGGEQISTQVKSLSADKSHADIVVAVLNSSLFYWWFIILSDCRHLNMREIETFPIGLDEMSSENRETLKRLSTSLMIDLQAHAQRKDCTYKTTGRVIYDEFYPRYSKSIIDEIDRVLAKHYGFTEEELDFIINYDIKYRMGREEEE